MLVVKIKKLVILILNKYSLDSKSKTHELRYYISLFLFI